MKRKLLGSATFGTTQVKTDEYVMLAKTIVENGSSLEQADIEIRAIDDMLSMQQINPIIQANRFTPTGRIRKNNNLSDMISLRIDKLMDELKEVNALKKSQNVL
jgi:hypothetical protein